MPAGVKPQEFFKPICTVTSKEQGVLEVLSHKYKAWLSKARTGLHNGQGWMLVVKVLSLWAPPFALNFTSVIKIQKATLHQVTYGKVLHLIQVMSSCGGGCGFGFGFFSLNVPILFGMPKTVVGMDLSNFLSNQCLVSEMCFVGKSQKVTQHSSLWRFS